jgi:hypothetical protein
MGGSSHSQPRSFTSFGMTSRKAGYAAVNGPEAVSSPQGSAFPLSGGQRPTMMGGMDMRRRTFDCIRMKRQEAERVRKQLEGESLREQRERIPSQRRGLKMSVSKTRCFLLSVWIAACAGTTSCRLVDSKATGDRTQTDSSKKQAEKRDNRLLSKEEIVEAANRAARQRGYKLAKYDIFYDEGNAGWRYLVTRVSPPEYEPENGRPVWPEGAFEANLRSRWPKLESHDYQAVIYYRRPPAGRSPGIQGRTWVLVDRNTGEVLLVFAQAG